MKRIILASVILLSGCASAIMQGYVGRPLQDAMADYGPPVNAFDMGDGRRAFQWVIGSSYTMPTYTTTTGSVSGGWLNTNTVVTGGQTVNSRCVYTLYARPEGDQWVVDGFNPPRFMCE